MMFTTLLLGLASAADPTQNIVQLAQATTDLSTLVTAVVAADLVTTLSGTGPFTLFAPTNAAFAALPAGTLASLLETANKEKLADLLKYHVVSGKILAADISNAQVVKTVEGNSISASVNDGKVFINQAQVTTPNVMATNGVVHIINAVLNLPTLNIVALAQNTTDLSTLVTAVVAADLATTLSGAGPFTLFAPTNAAFAALPAATLASLLEKENIKELQSVLKYHVVSGNNQAASLSNFQKLETLEGSDVTVNITAGSVFINQAKVITADIEATNGVVHIIDAVLSDPTGSALAKSFSAFAFMCVLVVTVNLM